jgi:hypothetical protein
MLNGRDSDRIEGKRLEDNASFMIAAVPWYKNSEKQRKTAAKQRASCCFSLAGSGAIQDFCGRGHLTR